MITQEVQLFFDQSQDIIAIIDRDLRYENVNLEFCRYWGVERETVIGSLVEEIVGKEQYGRAIREYMFRALRGEHTDFENWIDFTDMGRRYMNVKCTPRHHDGKVIGLLAVARDLTNSKELEAEIKTERDRYWQVLTATNVGLMLFNSDLTIEWHNLQLSELYPGKDILGNKCHLTFRNTTQHCEDCIARKTFQTNTRQRTEVYYPENDRWHAFSTEPIFDQNGKTVQALGHVTDITEQKKAENALKAKDAELRSIFKGSKVGLGILRNRIIQQANDHFFEMVGYQREELVGQDTRTVYATQEGYEQSGKIFYEHPHEDTPDVLEARWVRKDGAFLDVLISLTPVDPLDSNAGSAFAIMDITERKRTEEAVRQSEQRFREIFETVEMIAVQGYDKDRRVMYWNPASEQLYGYSRQEALGELLEDLIIPDHMKEDVRQGIATWMDGGPAIPAGELTLIHKDGSPVPVHSSHVMQQTTAGEKYMYCIDVDLAEIKRVQNQLIQARDEAQMANRSKSEFLANMSHEIRTPLNGIQGMLTLILGTDLDEMQRDYAQAGADSATRLNQLLSDILDLSQVEAGKLTLVEEPFSLPEIINQLQDLFHLASEEAGLNLRWDVAGAVPQYMAGDSARLRQILTNLLGNALKYTESGEVLLDVARLTPTSDLEERILFTVTDTGIGMQGRTLDKVFSPFIQGSQGYTRQYQGAGLGLAICKRLVDLMGGNMSVESTPNHGTSVHVALSFGKADGPATVLSCLPSDDVGYGFGLHILLAEDDNVNSMAGKRLLEKEGAIVTVVDNGKEALEVLQGKEFDMIFMDIQMPVMDGTQTTEAIRNGEAGEQNRGIFICALTAYAMTNDRERFLNAGMDAYVPKPFELDAIREILVKVAKAKLQ